MNDIFDDAYDPDALSAMFARQGEHQSREIARYGLDLSTPKARDAFHLALCRHLHGEVDELVRCVDWKIHARGETSSPRTIAQECVDVAKFLINIMLLHGISARDFVVAFHEKSTVVEKRVALEEMRLKADRGELGPILVCDLDGVVCARDTALMSFAVRRASEDIGPKHLQTTHQYRELFGQRQYEQLKRDFYESGGFLVCDVVVAARKTLTVAKEGYAIPILICTSRDVKRYPHLEWETHEWLRRNAVPYDAIVFSAEKERALTWIPRESIAVDDEEEHVSKLAYVCDARKYYMNDILDAACLDLASKRDAGVKA